MLTNIVLVIAGLLMLKYAADYFVSGSASLARKLGVSSMVVGLTVVSIGTSAPEFFVNMIAALRGSTALSVGNVLGSNLADILLGLGIAAMFVPLSIKRGTVWREIPFALMAAVMLLIFGSDHLLDGVLPNAIGRSEGFALLGFFVIFIAYTLGLVQKGEHPEAHVETHGSWKTIGHILGGVVGLALGGYIVVEGAVGIAEIIGISENLVGLTIVAAGTSLPEIMTAVTAARKKHVDLVVGGIVGTIIFNALFVLGSTALVRPLVFVQDNTTDAIAVVIATLILFLSLFLGKKHEIGKKRGVVFVALYIAYLIFAIHRG